MWLQGGLVVSPTFFYINSPFIEKSLPSWWDESMDDGHYVDSPLLTPGAFEGNGAGESGCVVGGPYTPPWLRI